MTHYPTSLFRPHTERLKSIRVPFTEKQSEMTLCRKDKIVFRLEAGKYAEKWISLPVSETVHLKIIAPIFAC